MRDTGTRSGRLGQGFHARADDAKQHQRGQHQRPHRPGETACHVQHLGLTPQRQFGELHLVGHKGRIHQVDGVAPLRVKAHRFLHQRRHFFDLCVCQGRAGGLALGVGADQVVQHHGHIDPLDHAGCALDDLDRLVHFVVDDGLALGRATRAALASCRQALGRPVDGRRSRCGRLIRRRTRHTTGHATCAAVAALDRLLAANGTAVGRLVRLVRLGRRLGLGEIQLSRHLCLDIRLADDGLQYVEHAAAVERLDLLHVLQLVAIGATCSAAIRWRRQQLARVVEHTDGAGIHLGHAGGHQVHDAGELRAVQRTPRVQAQQNGSRGLLLLTVKTILVRQRQVHAGILHRRQGLDGARQLTFQTALKGQTLLELRHAKARRVHLLKAGYRPLGQALGRKLQAHVVHPVSRHQDGSATLRILIRHVHRAELRNDGAAVLVRQIGKQHAPLRLTPHHHTHDANGHKQHHPQGQAQALALVQTGQSLN